MSLLVPSDITRDFHGNRGDIILLRGLSLNTEAYESASVGVCVCGYQCKRQRMCKHVCLCVCEGPNGRKCGNLKLLDALQRLQTDN